MYVRRGVSRTVLIVGRWAIKVPTTRPYGRRGDRLWAWTRGYQANYSERQWRGTEGVASVIWSLFGIVQCYPRCEPVDESWENAPDAKFDEISSIIPFGDRKPSNIGVLNGRTVWIDYDSSWNGCSAVPWHDS